MTTVRIMTSATAGLPPRRKLTIRGTISTDTITVPYMPQTGSRTGMTGVWARQPRPGRPDALVYTNAPTPVLALDLTFLRTDFRNHVEAPLKAFRTLVANEEAVLLSGCSSSWAGPWHITDANEEIQDLSVENLIWKAVVHVTFTATDKNNMDGTGPVTGGVTATKTAGVWTYTVKRGDTLPGIAAKQLGNSAYYGIIAAINGMRTTTVHAGQKLKMPSIGKAANK